MIKSIITFSATWVSITSPAYADCVDVIRAAALRGTVVEGSASLDAETKMFCSEYASLKSKSNSVNLSGSYGAIGIGVGTSSAKVDQVASKYCDASTGYSSRINNYSQYIESIAPGAFSAYSDCTRSNGSIVADLSPLAIQANNMTIIVSNKSPVAAAQQIAYTAPGFDCLWLVGKSNVKNSEITLPAASTTTLQCNRKDQSREGSVSVVATSAINGNYVFLWKKFQSGMPIDELRAIRDANLELVKTLGSAVFAFDAESCPAGWASAPGLAGRTIIGAGSSTGLTDRKNGEIGGAETHVLTVAEMPSHTHDVTFTDHNNTPKTVDTSPGEYGNSNTKETSTPTGGGLPHNNMPPFAVYQYCRKSA